MKFGISVKGILLNLRLRIIYLRLRQIGHIFPAFYAVQVVPLINGIFAGAPCTVHNGSKSLFIPVAHIIFVGFRIFCRRSFIYICIIGSKGQTFLPVYRNVAGPYIRCGIPAHCRYAGRIYIRHAVNGSVLILYQNRINNRRGVCARVSVAVREKQRKTVLPGLPAVCGHGSDGIQSAAVPGRLVPGVRCSQQTAVLRCDHGRDTEIKTSRCFCRKRLSLRHACFRYIDASGFKQFCFLCFCRDCRKRCNGHCQRQSKSHASLP